MLKSCERHWPNAGALASALAIALLLTPVAPGRAAASEPNVDAAIKALETARLDPERLKSYCEASLKIEAARSDAGSEAADAEIETILMGLAPELSGALRLEAELNPDTPEGDAYMQALHGLGEACAKSAEPAASGD